MAEVARALGEPTSLDDTLSAIIGSAVEAVPAVDGVSISVIKRDGSFETVAATSDLVRLVDQAQYESDEGPCVEALEQRVPIVVDSLQDEARWPVFGPRADKLGLRARMGALLCSDATGAGALNFYSSTVDTFDDDARHLALLFARHAAVAMGGAQVQDVMDRELTSRQELGQALGITMERYTINEETAFAFLVRTSQKNSVKLGEVAHALSRQSNNAADRRRDDSA